MKIDMSLDEYLLMESKLLSEDSWRYINDELYGENVKIADVVACYGSPIYIYSRQKIEANCQQFTKNLQRLPVRVCYATKANNRLGILKVIKKQGIGMDTMSGGEIARSIAAGVEPKDIIFSGVGKSPQDIEYAVKIGIDRINVEAEEEIHHIHKFCEIHDKRIRIGFRFNPDVEAGGNDKIKTGRKQDKFGLDYATILRLWGAAAKSERLCVNALSMHIGSMIDSITHYETAGKRLLELAAAIKEKGYAVQHFDLGGGYGIQYSNENAFNIRTLKNWIASLLEQHGEPRTTFDIEPGRSIVGNAGILATRVNAVKHSGSLLVVDAGMHTIMRPYLYDSYQHVLPLHKTLPNTLSLKHVVGPICESGDKLALNRWLPELAEGHFLALLTAGAYGAVLTNQYNARGTPSEVLIDGENTYKIFQGTDGAHISEKECNLTMDL